MHLFISNSESPRPPKTIGRTGSIFRRSSLALIASVMCVMLASEFLSRYAFPRISQIEGRIHDDERQVLAIRTVVPGSPPTVLLVGNSLLVRGLDYPRIRAVMAPDMHVVRFAIENTEYLDWYYGLRRLFASGIRPSLVVLCLNLGQTASPRTLGDYSARHLFGTSELLPVAHDAGMDATRTSGLFLAHWSVFYASRAVIRNFILNKAAPAYAGNLHHLADNTRNPLPPDDELVLITRARLHAVDQLCRQSGVELVLLIPPSVAGHNDLLASTAKLESVDFDYPFPAGALGPELFRPDGAHLNEKGAVIFTQALVPILRARVATRVSVETPPPPRIASVQ
jgi:hypothetical protein